jgi:hypothetical protein
MARLKESFDDNGDDIDVMQISQIINPGHKVDSWESWRFIAWGEKYVYFPCENCGDHFVESVPRNPCNIER